MNKRNQQVNIFKFILSASSKFSLGRSLADAAGNYKTRHSDVLTGRERLVGRGQRNAPNALGAQPVLSIVSQNSFEITWFSSFSFSARSGSFTREIVTVAAFQRLFSTSSDFHSAPTEDHAVASTWSKSRCDSLCAQSQNRCKGVEVTTQWHCTIARSWNEQYRSQEVRLLCWTWLSLRVGSEG